MGRAEARSRYYCREEAQRLNWDTRHPGRGGQFLEEQEIVGYFPELLPHLRQKRPDFVVTDSGRPIMVIETKSSFRAIDEALVDAEDYAERISNVYPVYIIVGIAGTPDTSVQVRSRYKHNDRWIPLSSNGYDLTQIPTPDELQRALQNADGTTDVRLPNEEEFYEAAIAISRMLRTAKVEEVIRPKILGAIILALYQGDFSMDPAMVLSHINGNVAAAINACHDVPPDRRAYLIDTLRLSTESRALPDIIRQVVLQLERLNVRSIMRTSVDFLGQFYEAFLRYGADSKKLGIVFTPRHITRYCAELTNVQLGMTVYDPACGTGGFLVAGFDRMLATATTEKARQAAKESLYGFDTNSTVWALAILNMMFRGDGKSNIILDSCFDNEESVEGKFDRALLNPPFSQDDEPETDFIDHALRSLKPGGELAAVVPTGILVDSAHSHWRRNLIANHTLLATISLPVDLFYPTGAPTSLLVMKAHVHSPNYETFMAKVHNDGFTISKNRRIPVSGSQLPQVAELLQMHRQGTFVGPISDLACSVPRDRLSDGEEFCAEKWLPHAPVNPAAFIDTVNASLRQMYLAIVNFPEIVDLLIEDFTDLLQNIGQRDDSTKPTERVALNDIFEVSMGLSTGIGNYPAGTVPYVSSADTYNSIVGIINAPPEEIFDMPCITVTAFGQAHVQPWRFAARGNGGSAVRILTPRFPMKVEELLWYVGQINLQKWRFHYGRMAIISRLATLEVDPYPGFDVEAIDLPGKVKSFASGLTSLLIATGLEGTDIDELK